MYPILFTLGPLKISSFGVFLVLGILIAIYLIWKLAKIYDLEEEKVIDLAILTFFGGVIVARLYFVAWHLDAFENLGKIILVNKYPGLSFWGGLFGGILSLCLLVRRFRFNLWQVADFAAVGFWIGLILGNLGCFFGGCFYGVVSDLPIATPIIGVVGKRLPIAVIESLALVMFLPYLWRQVIRFHFSGKILSVSLIFLGLVKFLTGFYRGDIQQGDNIFPLILFVLGLVIYYRKSKRHLLADLKFGANIFASRKNREVVLSTLRKTCYNAKVNWKIRLGHLATSFFALPKILRRRFNVKPTPKNF